MINSTLTFANCCRNCGKGLLTDPEGDTYCLDCTSYRPAIPEPFVALVGAELVESADTLDELLDTLAEILDDKGSEDVAVWHGPRVVMILHADGRVRDFGGNR